MKPRDLPVRPLVRPKRAWLAGACVTALALAGTARAEEPRKFGEPNVLSEPAEITQVVDAFDKDDLFDVHVSLGYQISFKKADILRETQAVQNGLSTGGYLANTLNVAEYKESTSRLNARADVGLYRDVALVLRLPIILSNERELNGLDGSAEVQSVVLQGAPGEQLFSLPFKAPKRGGLEYLAIGVDAALMNQHRDPASPTWLVGLEGRFNLGEPLRACNSSPVAGELKCADPGDVDRNGVSAPDAGEGTFGGGERKSGVSRGVTALEFHTYASRRIKHIEPYAGFRALFEFPNASSAFGKSDLKGSLINHPPLRGTLLVGLNVIPWEIREQFQRMILDFRFSGTYVSEGRDYSELFDALGSSHARSLRVPNYAEYQRNPNYNPANPNAAPQSIIDPNSRRAYFTGLTDVQAHGQYTLSAGFTWQAGEYVKFNLGGSYTLVQSHSLTGDQACNSDFTNSLDAAGPCRSSSGDGASATGIPNPNYRRTINDPGQRFRVANSSQLDAWLNATVMF
ncbi:MAG TPA: hypothetical protein VFQ61_35025 [Polyangiaceae bacterium]|nr:hypothetical protein [Polyangiaceae bacterium]